MRISGACYRTSSSSISSTSTMNSERDFTKAEIAASKTLRRFGLRDPRRLVLEDLAMALGVVVIDAPLQGAEARLVRRGEKGLIRVSEDIPELGRRRFAIGHELGHQIERHPGFGQRQEYEADRIGANLAIASGYDVGAYVRKLFRDPNSCSRSHGCWHDRARALAYRYDVAQGEWDPKHRGHPSPTTHFPPDDASGRRRSPSPPRAPQMVQGPCQHRGPCFHRMPCQHWMPTPYGPRSAHPFDTMHPFDQAHPFDLVPR